MGGPEGPSYDAREVRAAPLAFPPPPSILPISGGNGSVSGQAAERREVYYSGRVQGVGFRYTVRNLAARFRVTGFVKNLPEGGVQLVVEGPPEEIEKLLAAVRQAMGRYIADAEETTGEASGRFPRFEIRH